MNIVVKILVFLITAGIVGLSSSFLLMFLHALQGRMDEILWGYVGFAVVVSIFCGLIAVLLTHLMVTRKQWNLYLVALASVIIIAFPGAAFTTLGPPVALAIYETYGQSRRE